MSLDPALLTTTFDSFRPFGASTPHLSNQACRLANDMPCGRGSGLSGILMWTHVMDVQPGTDVLDGCGREAGGDFVLYADGDGIRSPHLSGSIYAVVWTAIINQGTADEFLRVYLLRDLWVP
jgi:hypothetical protein